MKKILFFILPLISINMAIANEDVCCVLGGASGSGDNVQTFAKIMSSSDCKAGGTYEGKKVCAAVPDPENTYCGAEGSYKDRCGKCGFFRSGKECLTVEPKEKAKTELEEEAKKKEADKKAGLPTDEPAKVKPAEPSSQKSPDPDNPRVNNAIPEEDSLFSRRPRGNTQDQ